MVVRFIVKRDRCVRREHRACAGVGTDRHPVPQTFVPDERVGAVRRELGRRRAARQEPARTIGEAHRVDVRALLAPRRRDSVRGIVEAKRVARVVVRDDPVHVRGRERDEARTAQIVRGEIGFLAVRVGFVLLHRLQARIFIRPEIDCERRRRIVGHRRRRGGQAEEHALAVARKRHRAVRIGRTRAQETSGRRVHDRHGRRRARGRNDVQIVVRHVLRVRRRIGEERERAAVARDRDVAVATRSGEHLARPPSGDVAHVQTVRRAVARLGGIHGDAAVIAQRER